MPDGAKPALRAAGAGVRPEAASAPLPRPASGAARVRNGPARVAAFGGLGALIASMALIVATTQSGSPARPPAAGARVIAAGRHRIWTVRPGQTLSSIAARESVSVSDLERLNPRLVPNGLASGQRVRLPA